MRIRLADSRCKFFAQLVVGAGQIYNLVVEQVTFRSFTLTGGKSAALCGKAGGGFAELLVCFFNE